MSAMAIAPDAGVHVEFEAPMSADSQQHRAQRSSERFSIDLSLELEHQLEHMESPSHPDPDSTSKRESLDPHVLAHIIMQLRHSLAEMTKERDELVKALSSALSKEAQLNDALQLMTDKATGMEEELAGAKKKVKEDEEAISMLRSKVEESR
jgi:chromosome segregation ATPase